MTSGVSLACAVYIVVVCERDRMANQSKCVTQREQQLDANDFRRIVDPDQRVDFGVGFR
jgi:hypothetical protein